MVAGPGLSVLVAILLALGAAGAAAAGVRRVLHGLRDGDAPAASLRIVRGIRGIVVAVALWALAAGLLFSQTWLLVFGGIFLGEELYETGVVVRALGAGRRANP
jgi:hypothetical protein